MYELQEERVIVYAVADPKREPGFWKKLSTECTTRGAAGLLEYRESKAIGVGSASLRQHNPR
jgi:hypothetical protein